MSINLSVGNSKGGLGKQATLNTYSDVRLSKVKSANGVMMTIDGHVLHLFDHNNNFTHNKIKYGTTSVNELLTVKDIGNLSYYASDEAKEFQNVRNLAPDKKKFFINSFVSYPFVYMDFFEQNVYDYLHKSPSVPKDVRYNIINFIFEAIEVVYNQGKCFTDIKPEQVLVRTNAQVTGKYHTFRDKGKTYELALADLDYKLCTHYGSYISTYTLPSWTMKDIKQNAPKREAILQTLFAFGATALNILGIKDDAYLGSMNPKTQILKDMNEMKAMGVPEYLRKVIVACVYDINSKTSWTDIGAMYRS
jgi:serine/threonine protein kinase